MKIIYFFFFLITLSCGLTRTPRQSLAEIIGIKSYENENNYDGSYRYRYETENGISVEEEGSLKPGGEEGEGIQTARGSYSYTGPDGNLISVTWYADETGFHAEGDHIPKTQGPPSVPVTRSSNIPPGPIPVPGPPRPVPVRPFPSPAPRPLPAPAPVYPI